MDPFCDDSDAERKALLDQLAFDLEHGELLNCQVRPDGRGFQTKGDPRDDVLLTLGPVLPEAEGLDAYEGIDCGIGNLRCLDDDDEPTIKFNTKTNSVTNEVTVTSISIPRRQKLIKVMPIRIVLTNIKREDAIATTTQGWEKIKPPRLQTKKKKKKVNLAKFTIPARKRKIEHVTKRPDSLKVKNPVAKKFTKPDLPKLERPEPPKKLPPIKKPKAPKKEAGPLIERLKLLLKKPGMMPAALVKNPEAPITKKPKDEAINSKSHKKKPEVPKMESQPPIEKLKIIIKKPETQAKKPEALIKRPEAPIKKPEALIKKPEASIKKPEASIKKPEASIKKPEAPIKKPEAPIKKPEASIKKPEAPIKKPEARAKKPESRSKKPEVHAMIPNALIGPLFPDANQIKKFKIPKLVKPVAQIGRPESPIRRSLSPEDRKSSSPERSSISPERSSISPDRISHSPIQKPMSPSEAILFDDLITLNFEIETETSNPEPNSPAKKPQSPIDENVDDKPQSPIEEKSDSLIKQEENIFDEPAPEAEALPKNPEAPKIVAEPKQPSENDGESDDDDVLNLFAEEDDFGIF